MPEGLTQAIFGGIMGLGCAVWAWSLLKALSMSGDGVDDDEFDVDYKSPPRGVETGERTIHGDPEQLSKNLVRSLLKVNIGMFGSLFEVTERTAKKVVIKKTGPLVCNQPAGLYFSEAEFYFEPIGGDAVRVTYTLGFERLRRMFRRTALGIILGIGMPVLLVLGSVLWFTVVQSDNPIIRFQVFQTLHIGHALWPPFMFIGFYSMGRRHSKTFVSNLLTMLEVGED